MVKVFFLQIHMPVNGIFYTGQDVTGTVTIRTKRSKKYSNIQVSLTGEALVPRRHEANRKWARYELLNQQYILWDRERATGNELAPGNYEFPFSLRLQSPHGLPSTYESPLANISYTVEARIVKDGGILKRESKSQTRIQVVDVVDINRRDLLEPKVYSTESDLSVAILLPRTGFSVHEDSIDFELEVQNPNKRCIGQVSVQLIKKSTYTDGGVSRDYSSIVPGASTTSVAFSSHSNCSWRGSIPVPLTQPTTMNCCCIHISYYLRVSLDPMSSASLECLEAPITIGTVPFRDPTKVDLCITPTATPPHIHHPSQPGLTPPPACHPPHPLGQVYPDYNAPNPQEPSLHQSQDSPTVQATAPLAPESSEGATQQPTIIQWTLPHAAPQPALCWVLPQVYNQPYWTTPQAPAIVPQQRPHSSSFGTPASMENGKSFYT